MKYKFVKKCRSFTKKFHHHLQAPILPLKIKITDFRKTIPNILNLSKQACK